VENKSEVHFLAGLDCRALNRVQSLDQGGVDLVIDYIAAVLATDPAYLRQTTPVFIVPS
jgi:hypothetical protein